MSEEERDFILSTSPRRDSAKILEAAWAKIKSDSPRAQLIDKTDDALLVRVQESVLRDLAREFSAEIHIERSTPGDTGPLGK